MMIRRAFSSGVRSQFRTTPSVFGALNSVRFIAVDKEIDKKKIVERFLEDKEHSGEDYLGIHIVEDDHYANAKTEKHVKNVISSFSLSDKVPATLSSSYDSLYSRMQKSLNFVANADWASLDGPEAFDMYDEWQVTNKLFEKNKESFSKSDLEILQPLNRHLNNAWGVCLKAERINSILINLTNKYVNTFAFPQSDYKLIINCVDAYFEVQATEKDELLRNKFSTIIERQLGYLKDRIVLPELSLKYPSLFK